MENDADANRQKAWSSYWASGVLSSCADSYQGNYRGVIAEFWGSRFEGLCGGNRVLDIATGNGPLPKMLLQRSPLEPPITIDAVDLADVAPDWLSLGQGSNVRFHPGTRMERLPFDDESFELVVSQYGIEYGKWPEALIESLRVCRVEGSLAFVVHHADSVLVDVGRRELLNHGLLKDRCGLFESARAVIPWLGVVRRGELDPGDRRSAEASKAAYNRAMTEVQKEIDSSKVPDLLIEARHTIHQIVSTTVVGVDQSLDLLDRYSDSLGAAALRTEEMTSHAFGRANIDSLESCVADVRPGWRVTSAPIIQGDNILGWRIVAGPAAAIDSLSIPPTA